MRTTKELKNFYKKAFRLRMVKNLVLGGIGVSSVGLIKFAISTYATRVASVRGLEHLEWVQYRIDKVTIETIALTFYCCVACYGAYHFTNKFFKKKEKALLEEIRNEISK